MSGNKTKIEVGEDILKLLSETGKYMKTIDIAKKLNGETGASSQVNPALYTLKTQNKVKQKTEEGGRNPQWKFRSPKEKNAEKKAKETKEVTSLT